jgi:hypothetical protein
MCWGSTPYNGGPARVLCSWGMFTDEWGRETRSGVPVTLRRGVCTLMLCATVQANIMERSHTPWIYGHRLAKGLGTTE